MFRTERRTRRTRIARIRTDRIRVPPLHPCSPSKYEPPFKNLGYWGSVDDRAVWTINVTKPGKHSIRLNYACDNGTAGNEVVFEVAGQSVKAKIVGTGSWENYQTAILGELNLSAGQHRLTVRSAETLKNHLMDLKELRLVPE